jgi:S-adenosylmethionine-diacylgycerolhomoserine-N-methlytransferase
MKGGDAVTPDHPEETTSLAATRALYALHAPFYDLTRRAFLPGRGAAVELLRLQAGEHALEVGCGTGTNLLRLRERVGARGEVHGIDLSPHMLARARTKLARRGWSNVHLYEREAGELDLERRFDAVLYSYSLSMIPAWRESLVAAVRQLAPGGRLAVVDFGDLRGCAVLRGAFLRWFRAHHVDTERPYLEALQQLFGKKATVVHHGRGRWHFRACATLQGD